MSAPGKALLLVDAHSLFRRTLAMVARDLHLGEIHEAASITAARRQLETHRFDGLLLDIADALPALALLQSLRGGQLASPADLPVALMAEDVDLATIELFKQQQVQRLMLKPFKVRTALEVVAALAS